MYEQGKMASGTRSGSLRSGIKTRICLVMVIVPLLLAACGHKDQGSASPQAAAIRYTLTYAAGENGSIRGSSPQKVEPGGSGSPVTAVAAPGYLFSGWSDGTQNATRTDRNVNGDIAVTARFVPARPTLNYSAGDHGSIDGAVQQQIDHGGSGSPVTAVAAPGYHFTEWSDGMQSATRTESNVTVNIAVTARFAIDRHSLTYLAGKHGAITGARLQKVAYGSAGSSVRAVPEKGYQFSAWSDGSTANPRKDAQVKNVLRVTARFTRIHYMLTYVAQANGSIEGPNLQDVAYGDGGATVTAVPATGYHFVAWSDGLTTATRREAKVVGDQTVSAVFAVDTYTIGGRVTGLVEGARLVLRNEGGEDLTVTANGEFRVAKPGSDRHPLRGLGPDPADRPQPDLQRRPGDRSDRCQGRHRHRCHLCRQHLYHRRHGGRPAGGETGGVEEQRRGAVSRRRKRFLRLRQGAEGRQPAIRSRSSARQNYRTGPVPLNMEPAC